jgi:hypothetical protein
MFRDKKYLAAARGGASCCGCGRPAEHAHHFDKRRGGGGTGIKPSDTYSAPLCAACHDFVHQHGTLPCNTKAETELTFYRAALAMATRWIERLSTGNG